MEEASDQSLSSEQNSIILPNMAILGQGLICEDHTGRAGDVSGLEAKGSFFLITSSGCSLVCAEATSRHGCEKVDGSRSIGCWLFCL